MSNYTVLHMEKMVTVSSVLERHITRKEVRYVGHRRMESSYSPNNADPDLAFLNQELVSRFRYDKATGNHRTLSISQTIKERLQETGVSVRKGQNTAIEVLFSGSPDVMNSMERHTVYSWAEATLSWAEKEWGKENIVAAVLHMDEKTPHIHMIMVPLVQGQSRRSALQEKLNEEAGKTVKKYNIDRNRLRLSSNDVYTQPLLYHYHSSYAEEVGARFGLQRGLMAEAGSKKRHQTSIEYNRQLEREAAEKASIIQELRADYRQSSAELAEVNQRLEKNRKRLAEMTSESLYLFMKQWTQKSINKLKSLIEEEYNYGRVTAVEEIPFASGTALKCEMVDPYNQEGTIYVDLQDGGVFDDKGRPITNAYSGSQIHLKSVIEYMSQALSPEAVEILTRKLMKSPSARKDSTAECTQSKSTGPKM